MGEKERKYLPGLTAKSIIIGALMVIVLSGVYSDSGLNRFRFWYPTWTQDMGTLEVYGFALMLIVVLAILNAAGNFFTKQEVAVITIMILMGTWWNFHLNLEQLANRIIFAYAFSPGTVLRYAGERLEFIDPLVFGPLRTPELVNMAVGKGIGAINWAAWSPTLLWTFMFWGGMALCMMFLALLMRHLYVEELNLPFTMVIAHEQLIDLTQRDGGRLGIFRAKWFWIAFVIQFVLGIPYVYFTAGQYNAVTSGPGYVGIYPMSWEWDYTKYAITPWAAYTVYLWPWLIAWAYIWPMEAINGFLVGYLIYHIMFPWMFTSLGWMPPFPTGIDCWTVKCTVAGYGVLTCPQFPAFHQNVAAGSVLAIVAYTLWVSRSSIKRVFGTLTKKDEQLEADSPLPYRIIWAGFIVFGLVATAAVVIMGAPVTFALLWIIIVVIMSVGYIRAFAETGARWGGFGYQMSAYLPLGVLLLYGFGYTTQESATATSLWYYIGDVRHSLLLTFTACFAAYTLLGFKLSNTTSTEKRGMLKAMFIAGILGIVVTILGSVIWIHALPAYAIEGSVPYNIMMDAAGYVRMGTFTDRPFIWCMAPRDASEAMGYVNGIGLSFIITTVFYLVRTVFPAFRIAPVGLLGAVLWDSGEDPGWGFPMLVAWVAKALTYRIGGTKAYEEKGKPTALGLSFGYCVVIAIWVIFGALHNFGLWGSWY